MPLTGSRLMALQGDTSGRSTLPLSHTSCLTGTGWTCPPPCSWASLVWLLLWWSCCSISPHSLQSVRWALLPLLPSRLIHFHVTARFNLFSSHLCFPFATWTTSVLLGTFVISFLPTCDFMLFPPPLLRASYYCPRLSVHLFQLSRKRKNLPTMNIFWRYMNAITISPKITVQCGIILSRKQSNYLHSQ